MASSCAAAKEVRASYARDLADGRLAETGGDHGNLHRIFHLLVQHGAENDVGIFVRGALNDRAGLLHFGELERCGTGDVDEDAARAIDGAGLEQRRGDGFLRGFDGALALRWRRPCP